MSVVASLCMVFLLTLWYQRDKMQGELFLQFVYISITTWLTKLAFSNTNSEGENETTVD